MDCKHVVAADREAQLWLLPRSGSNESSSDSHTPTSETIGDSDAPAAPTAIDWSPAVPTVRVAWRQRRMVCLRWHLRQRVLRGSFRDGAGHVWRNGR